MVVVVVGVVRVGVVVGVEVFVGMGAGTGTVHGSFVVSCAGLSTSRDRIALMYFSYPATKA